MGHLDILPTNLYNNAGKGGIGVKKSIYRCAAAFFLLVLLVQIGLPVTGYGIQPETLEQVAGTVDAQQVFVYDYDRDVMLYAKTVEGGKLYPSSTTKLFTAYVALQHLQADTVVTAGDELDMVKPGSSIAYIKKGHQLTVEMLVQAMLLPSGNDAAMVLAAAAGRAAAEDDALTGQQAVRAFVEEMNRTADALQFQKSHFVNPDGFHVGSHYSCLEDMIQIGKLAMDNPVISKYMRVPEADVVYHSGQTNHWKNTNYLLDAESEFYHPDAVGMKTGYTNAAGNCLMAAFAFQGRTLIIGIFGDEAKQDRFTDAAALADACK